MSLLSLVQTVTDRLALPRLTQIVGANNDNARLLVALANQEGRELAARATWQVLTKEQAFITVATESQGALSAIITDDDFHHVLNNVMWNRTTNQPVYGSVSPQRWQQQKSASVTGPYPHFRIRNDELLFLPTPSAGQTVAFEYISANWCQKSDETASYSAWNADTDTGLLDENLMADGVLWRYKRQKGFDYAEEFAAYERMVSDALARDGGRTWLDFNGRLSNPLAPPAYPEGSWT